MLKCCFASHDRGSKVEIPLVVDVRCSCRPTSIIIWPWYFVLCWEGNGKVHIMLAKHLVSERIPQNCDHFHHFSRKIINQSRSPLWLINLFGNSVPCLAPFLWITRCLCYPLELTEFHAVDLYIITYRLTFALIDTKVVKGVVFIFRRCGKCRV